MRKQLKDRVREMQLAKQGIVGPEADQIIEAEKAAGGTPVVFELWDRLDDETDKAWSVFSAYRDAGFLRDKATVAKSLGYKNAEQLKNYSARYNWPERLAAFDAAVTREAIIEAKRRIGKQLPEAIEKVFSATVSSLEKCAQHGRAGLTECLAALRWVMEWMRGADEEGVVVEVPEDATESEAAAILANALKEKIEEDRIAEEAGVIRLYR